MHVSPKNYMKTLTITTLIWRVISRTPIDQEKFPKLGLDHTWRMILRSRKPVMPSPQPAKQNNQKIRGPLVTILATSMQDIVAQPMVI